MSYRRLKLRLALLAGLASASVGAGAAQSHVQETSAPKAERIAAEAFMKEIATTHSAGSAQVVANTQALSRTTKPLAAEVHTIIIGLIL